jgi:hypothetical protein
MAKAIMAFSVKLKVASDRFQAFEKIRRGEAVQHEDRDRNAEKQQFPAHQRCSGVFSRSGSGDPPGRVRRS